MIQTTVQKLFKIRNAYIVRISSGYDDGGMVWRLNAKSNQRWVDMPNLELNSKAATLDGAIDSIFDQHAAAWLLIGSVASIDSAARQAAKKKREDAADNEAILNGEKSINEVRAKRGLPPLDTQVLLAA